MPPEVGSATRVFAVLGDPVGHSLSPRLHNAAFEAEGLDAVYVALRTDADGVAPLMRALARAGGGGNVTVPHKQLAAAALDLPTESVRRIGACNTFWLDGDRVAGDNTDVEGFEHALRSFTGDPRGARVLLFGAGGAAAAALLALLNAGVEAVVIVNRTASRAEQLAARIAGAGHERVRVAPGLQFPRGERFDLAVNATSLGLRADDPQPAPTDAAPYDAAMDLVYAPGGTPWTRAAREAGIPAIDGHEMLLRQAAAAFERWWQRPAPLGAMRAALEDRFSH